jgi:TIR domain
VFIEKPSFMKSLDTALLLNIFFAYSRVDSSYRERLDKHLSGLKRKEYINTWYDGKIEPGKEWEKEIDNELSRADIILLLISADFIASDYCYEHEMRKAISRHEKGDAVIVPVLLHPCDWHDTPFAKIQALPQNGKPVSDPSWHSGETAFNEIALKIKEIVERLFEVKSKQIKSVNEVLHERDSELRITLSQLEEKQLELDILEEEISKKKREKDELTGTLSSLAQSKIELEQGMIAEKSEAGKVLHSLQVDINKNRTVNEKLHKEKTSIEKEIEKLKLVRDNLKVEVDKMTSLLGYKKRR